MIESVFVALIGIVAAALFGVFLFLIIEHWFLMPRAPVPHRAQAKPTLPMDF